MPQGSTAMLLGTISTCCTFSMTLATILIAGQNYHHTDNAAINTKHLHQNVNFQKLAENFKFEIQQIQQQQQQQQQIEENEQRELSRKQLHDQNIFNPFNFPNLRQLQAEQKQKRKQIAMQHNYDNNDNRNDYFDNYNKFDQQQQQQHNEQQQHHLLHSRRCKDNENCNNKNNEGNEYKSGYPYDLFDDNSNKNNNNNDNSNRKNNNDDDKNCNEASNNENDNNDEGDNGDCDGNGDGNDDVDGDGDGDGVETENANVNVNENDNRNENNNVVVFGIKYKNGNPNNNGDWATPSSSTHQDASNDFRLQLSNRNEPARNNKNNSNNNNYNNDNYGNKKNNNTISKSNKNNNNISPSITNTGNAHNDGHRNRRTNGNSLHKSATHKDAYNSNNNENENENENNNNNDNSNSNNNSKNIPEDTSNRHTNKIRDDQSYDRHHYAHDMPIEPEEEDYDSKSSELDMELPYGIQNVQKRNANYGTDRESIKLGTTYQSLCPTKRISIPLETVGYEYRPDHYIEITCTHNVQHTHHNEHNHKKNKICTEAGFSCVQLNRTIQLIRRNKAVADSCWESEIRIVPSGCECMWPKHSNGDIITFHGNTQKRFISAKNYRPAMDDDAPEILNDWKLTHQIDLVDLNDQQRREDYSNEKNKNNNNIGYETYFVN